MKKRCIVLFCFSILLIIIPFMFNLYSIYRLVSIMIGILLLSLSASLNKNNHVIMIFVLPLLAFAISYGIDILLFYTFKRIPIYIYEVVSSDRVSNYNSFFYRIYKCNKDLYMDYGYNKEYLCNINDLEIVDINELLLNPEDSYTKYKNKFIRVHGKISKIVNLDRINLSLWNKDEVSINGNVDFNFNYNLIVPIKEDLNELRIYEEIDVVGRISKLNGDSLYMRDVKLIPSDVYNTWSYEIVLNNDKEYKNIIDNYYYYGISELNIKYSDELIYELSYLINDKKMSVDDLIKDKYVSNLYKDEDSNVIGEEYLLDKFKVLRCSNNVVVLSNLKNKLSITSCQVNK